MDVYAAVAAAVHEELSLLKMELNAAQAINLLPSEVLGAVFFHLTTEPSKPLENAIRASLVCRHWRAVALSTPRVWTRIEIEDRDGSYDLFYDILLGRSGALPLVVRCPGGRYCFALAPHMHRVRSLTISDSKTESDFDQLLTARSPLLQSLWMPLSDRFPPNLFDNCAPSLTTLGIESRAIGRAVPYLALSNITRLHLLHPLQGYFLLNFNALHHILTQCPRLVSLIGLTPVEAQHQLPATLPDDLALVHGVNVPFDGRVLDTALALLRHERVAQISIVAPSARTVTVSAEGLCASAPVVSAMLDRVRGRIELLTACGRARIFTDFKDHWRGGHYNLFQQVPIAATLVSLTVAGHPVQPDWHPLPCFPSLRTLTLVIHMSDQPPYAMSLRWSCPQLQTLRFATIKGSESIDLQPLKEFVSLKLDVPRPLKELRLDNVFLRSGVSADVEADKALSSQFQRIVYGDAGLDCTTFDIAWPETI